jgi:small GTP-binding protein
MGGSLTAMCLSVPQEAQLLMVGLDAAGKTSILYSLTLGQPVATMPTVGFNVETVSRENVNMKIWDVGGQSKIRRSWRHFSMGAVGIIFVVDSSDHERMEEAREELHSLLQEEGMQSATVLVFANKQDMPEALDAAAIADRLGLHGLRSRSWFVQEATATCGAGMIEGMDWLAREVRGRLREVC